MFLEPPLAFEQSHSILKAKALYAKPLGQHLSEEDGEKNNCINSG